MADLSTNTVDLAVSYLNVKRHVISKGFAWEVDWQESQCLESLNESELYREAAWVILSSGMSVRSVSSVFDKISKAFLDWKDPKEILSCGDSCINDALRCFNHIGKISAILSFIKDVDSMGFDVFKIQLKEVGVEYLQKFSFLGPATSFHLAKNIGLDVVKPDRHLLRLAEALNFSTPYLLCRAISNQIDEKMAVIDVVLWRYCVLNPDYIRVVKRFSA